jgi:hypothetical protein
MLGTLRATQEIVRFELGRDDSIRQADVGDDGATSSSIRARSALGRNTPRAARVEAPRAIKSFDSRPVKSTI